MLKNLENMNMTELKNLARKMNRKNLKSRVSITFRRFKEE